jgi:hypothetical protein
MSRPVTIFIIFDNPMFWLCNSSTIKQLQEVAMLGGNVFEELMETVKVASLG